MPSRLAGGPEERRGPSRDREDVTTPSLTLHLGGPDSALRLLGFQDRNLRALQKEIPLKATARGGSLLMQGDGASLRLAEKVFQNLSEFSPDQPLGPDEVRAAIQKMRSGGAGGASNPVRSDQTSVHLKKGVGARSPGQEAYLRALAQNDLCLALGPAGTGKTYLAVYTGLGQLFRGEIKKLVLVRPAVEAGERLGFLPGDLKEKVDPYLRPLYDALQDLAGADRLKTLTEAGAVEIAPLAYMRGRTLEDSYIILDEAQNATPEQMKMFLTRLGLRSKAAVTGDESQTDLPAGTPSGLVDAARRLKGIPGIAIVHLGPQDVVRHPLVKEILKAYGGRAKKS